MLIPLQKKVGTIAKDSSSGPFADDWRSAFGDISKDVEEVDVSTGLSLAALAVKDENELVCYKGWVVGAKSLIFHSDRCAMPPEHVQGL